jgi:hypothetical protein
MNVALQMVDRDERLVEGEGQGFGVADADEERSGKPGALSNGNGINRFVCLSGFGECLPNDGNNRAQMLA